LTGVFAAWQPVYAGHGISTFPVSIVGKDKRPAVKGYLKLGADVSEQLAIKFPSHDAIGLACRRNKITVLDVDTPDERVLADGLARHGQSPFIVRSGSGHFQAWYRHNGEGRRIRPDPRVPIDILGHGYVVAPPSRGALGIYRIVAGKYDDLDRLPVMRSPLGPAQPAPSLPTTNDNEEPVADFCKAKTREGNRNDILWRHCMKSARQCRNIEELMGAAMEHNKAEMMPPLPAEEVLRIVASAWGYEVEGKNWFGYGPRVVFAADEVDDLAAEEPRAWALLSVLRRHHNADAEFALAKGMAESLRWSINTFRDARLVLDQRGLIECVHKGGRGPNDPPIYRFMKGGKK